MSNKNKTVVKSTPAEVAKEKEADAKANLSQELNLEHPVGKLREELAELVEKATADELYSPAILTTALTLGVIPQPPSIPEDILAMLSSPPTYSDTEAAADEFKQGIAEMKEILSQHETGFNVAIMRASQTAQKEAAKETAALKELTIALQKQTAELQERCEAAEKKAKGKKKPIEAEAESEGDGSDDSDDDSSDEESDSDIDDFLNGKKKFMVRCKENSKTAERLAKAETKEVSQSIIKSIDNYIRASEEGKVHDAAVARKAIFEAATGGLTIGADAAGNVPINAAVKNGLLGGGSEEAVHFHIGSSRRLQTLNLASTSDSTDTLDSFSNMPISGDEMERYIELAERKLVDSKVNLPPCFKRKHDGVECNKNVTLSLIERVISQKKIFNHFLYTLKKNGKKYENGDAYTTIINRLTELIKNNKEVPIPAYEKPDEITLCMRAAKMHLHLASYLMSEIQKLNKDQASFNYTANAFRLFSEDGQMRSDETMSAFMNRVQSEADHGRQQNAPFDLGTFGFAVGKDGVSHGLYTDAFLAYHCIINFNREALKRDKTVRTFIDEDLLQRATEGKCTMDEVHELVTRMNKLNIAAVKPGSKSHALTQSQTFSSISNKKSNSDKKKSHKQKKHDSSLDRPNNRIGRLKLYQQMVASLGGAGFPNLDKSIDIQWQESSVLSLELK